MKITKDLVLIYIVGFLYMMVQMMPNPVLAGYALSLGATATFMSLIAGFSSLF